MTAVVWLEEVGKDDVSVVGGKGASLGEMINVSAPVPGGFAVTAKAYGDFISRSGIASDIFEMLKVDVNDSATMNGAAYSDSLRYLLANMTIIGGMRDGHGSGIKCATTAPS